MVMFFFFFVCCFFFFGGGGCCVFFFSSIQKNFFPCYLCQPGNHLTFKELRKQYIRLCLLQATAKLFSHQDVLRQILAQHIPSDLSPAALAAVGSSATGVADHGVGSLLGPGSYVSGCTAGTGAVILGSGGSDGAGATEDDGAAGDGPAKVTLLQQLLMTSTQPSPLKAVFSVDEMEVKLMYPELLIALLTAELVFRGGIFKIKDHCK